MFPSCVLLLSSLLALGLGDPCSDLVYSALPDLPKRNPAYEEDSVPICDRYLPKKWYRAGYHQMPRQAPELAFCGTLYPYWMNGELPANGNTDYVTVCQVGFEDTCVKSRRIRVKNCGFYAVYELTPLDSCNAAYCFEPTERCVSGVPRVISVEYHNVSWVSTPKNENARLRQHKPTVNLLCNFIPLSNTELLYDITWYVDNTAVLENQTVTADTRKDAILSASQIVKANKKAGSMIHCVVGAKLIPDDYPCNTTSSPLFFAGIKLSTTNLEIERGGKATIQLEFTIPYADEVIVHRGIELNASSLHISISPMGNASSPCLRDSLVLEGCEVKVPAYKFSEREKYATNEWRKKHSLTIDNSDSGDFSIDRHLLLRLQTGGTQGSVTSPSKIFESVILPDVQINVREPREIWKGRYCKSITDPNLETFDSYSSRGCQLHGTFILYRNEAYNQEVQEKHFGCHGSATCNCAVAVRSGRDVFTVDICNGHTKLINFPFCEDKILKVRKASDRMYKVILPTGTMVSIEIRQWAGFEFLNIKITASPSDVNSTRGLCGILDGNTNNDFTGRDNIVYPTSNLNAFARTWMVNNSENLLIDSQSVFSGLPSISNTLHRVCTCSNSTEPGKGEISCNYGNYKDCKFVAGKEFHCILNPASLLRRKRDLSFIAFNSVAKRKPKDKTSLRRYKRQTSMSIEEANRTCLMEFEKSAPFLLCKEIVTHIGDSALASCISDLTITGDVNMTYFHIETTLDLCSTIIMLNSTFQRTEPDITHQIQALCPSNCSGNGECNEGNCTCDAGFAGSDCSFDLLGPPTITHISDFGLCDKSKEDCDEITLYGKYFLENMNSTCFITRNRMAEDGSVISTENIQRRLEERTLYEGYCPLEYGSNSVWATKFTFNISNDGSNFTENFNVYTYQSLCQELKNSSGIISITFKEGYCFVDGQCVEDGGNNPNNFCDVCNVTQDKYKWTFNKGHCYISGRCIADGEFDETRICYHCNTTLNATSWSQNTESCFINNACYFNEEKRDDNPCDICNVTRDQYHWSFNEDGYCRINGTCKQNGEKDQIRECKICNASIHKREWSTDSGYCFISNTCVKNGRVDDTNPCSICDATANQNNWTINQDCISTSTSAVPATQSSEPLTSTKSNTSTSKMSSEPISTTMEQTTTSTTKISTTKQTLSTTRPSSTTRLTSSTTLESTSTTQGTSQETTAKSTTEQLTTRQAITISQPATTLKQSTFQSTAADTETTHPTTKKHTITPLTTNLQSTITTDSITTQHETKTPYETTKESKLSSKEVIIVIALPSVAIIAIVIGCAAYFCRRSQKRKDGKSKENDSNGRSSWMRQFSNEARDKNDGRFQIPRVFEDNGNSYFIMRGNPKNF